ncbi:ribonuclease III [Methanobrevibacter wolinii]|uniref:ribonuclease III n=1 Tax=Methanobrevibacter wolinii TaxID=190977 RepID=UPI0005B293EF|nr:ribonuclease III [Methanobrevibacter wolinii]MDD5959098.1 ribonuclease III [Methanobrevibacter wolinii]
MEELLEKFDIVPNNMDIFEIAFIHGSYSTSHDLDYDYERLEFLGDSVLNLIVSDYIFNKYPKLEEGSLTKIRANYVCQSALIYYSKQLGLDKHIKVNDEEHNITHNEILSISADIFESFLGAIYIDQGMNKAREYLANNIFKYIDENKIFFYDYKSAVKEYGDATEVNVDYETVKEYGVPHDKTFVIRILIDGEPYGQGKGKNKKEAEQLAAQQAIQKLHIN